MFVMARDGIAWLLERQCGLEDGTYASWEMLAILPAFIAAECRDIENQQGLSSGIHIAGRDVAEKAEISPFGVSRSMLRSGCRLWSSVGGDVSYSGGPSV
jgi:hypothetical protein